MMRAAGVTFWILLLLALSWRLGYTHGRDMYRLHCDEELRIERQATRAERAKVAEWREASDEWMRISEKWERTCAKWQSASETWQAAWRAAVGR